LKIFLLMNKKNIRDMIINHIILFKLNKIKDYSPFKDLEFLRSLDEDNKLNKNFISLLTLIFNLKKSIDLFEEKVYNVFANTKNIDYLIFKKMVYYHYDKCINFFEGLNSTKSTYYINHFKHCFDPNRIDLLIISRYLESIEVPLLNLKDVKLNFNREEDDLGIQLEDSD
jgi:hypothetical protein